MDKKEYELIKRDTVELVRGFSNKYSYMSDKRLQAFISICLAVAMREAISHGADPEKIGQKVSEFIDHEEKQKVDEK